MHDPVALAVLAKAPLPGLTKTRLIPLLGAEGAARLQAWLIDRMMHEALRAALGPVTLWTTPDDLHPCFRAWAGHPAVSLMRQPDGDLGMRMAAAVRTDGMPTLIVGTDCPALDADHVTRAAAHLRAGMGVVITPADDGGYVLIGMQRPEPRLFSAMAWSTAQVMAATRQRMRECGLEAVEMETLADLDTPDDHARLRAAGLIPAALFP